MSIWVGERQAGAGGAGHGHRQLGRLPPCDPAPWRPLVAMLSSQRRPLQAPARDSLVLWLCAPQADPKLQGSALGRQSAYPASSHWVSLPSLTPGHWQAATARVPEPACTRTARPASQREPGQGRSYLVPCCPPSPLRAGYPGLQLWEVTVSPLLPVGTRPQTFADTGWMENPAGPGGPEGCLPRAWGPSSGARWSTSPSQGWGESTGAES